MMMRLRPYIAVLLATMLGLTGQAMAVARGMSSASGEMVICTGNGAVTLSIDENGDPAGPAHICPDCALSLIATVADVPHTDARPLARKLSLGYETLAFATPSVIIHAHARGPPVL